MGLQHLRDLQVVNSNVGDDKNERDIRSAQQLRSNISKMISLPASASCRLL